MVAKSIISLLHPCKELLSLFGNATKIGKSNYPLRLSERVVFEIVAYLYIRYMEFVEFVGHRLLLARHSIE